MRLERIELIGFKSFAEKTVFNFHPGITSIVGPNGCGKSNIVDAFKWVLGEQSAKSLRGDSMEDVIFFGSTTKKTKGMAEVTLVLSDVTASPADNPGGAAGPAPGNVSVTRRLYRSGESEYLMNKTHCRLKDIKNMFLDTGLELKAYSILEQGKMNSILNSKPQERRFLIEEVAGVMKYKVRKAEAVGKLELSKSNLQRLQDIINEVKRQINSIDRYAKKAERYKKLFEEIKEIDVRLARRNVIRLRDEVRGFTSAEDTLKGREAELSANLHSAEALIEEKKRENVDREKAYEELRSKLYATEKVVAEGEGIKELLKRDCQNMRERISRLGERDNELNKEMDASNAQRDTISGELSRMEAARESLQRTLDDRNSLLSGIETGIGEREMRLEEDRRTLFNRTEGLSILKNEIRHISATAETIGRKTDKSSSDIDSVRTEMTELEQVIAGKEKQFRDSEAELTQRTAGRQETLAALERKKQEHSAKEEALYRDREHIAALSSKLDSLREFEAEQRSQVGEEIQALCQVADLFETGPEYEAAIEAVLGDRLSVSVVQDRDDITRAAGLIKDQNIGRSGFISLSGTERRSSAGEDVLAWSRELDAAGGVVGRAIDLVRVKEGLEKVAAVLLGDVVIVQDLQAAFTLWETSRQTSGHLYFVTMDGEVLEPSGAVFCGVERGVLKVRRQIRELEAEITVKKEQVLSLEGTVSELKGGVASLEEGIAVMDGDIADREKHRHELKVKLTSLEEENGRLKRKLEFLTVERESEEKERENLQGLIRQKEDDCGRLEAERIVADQAILALLDAIAKKKETLETSRLELTDIRLDITAAREKMAAHTGEKERLSSVIADIEGRKAGMAQERLGIENTILLKEEEMERKEEELRSSVRLIDELKEKVSVMKEELDTVHAELSVMEDHQKGAFSELDSLRKELSQIEVKNKEASLDLKYIIEEIRRTYSFEIESADVSAEVTPEEEERLPQLKEKLQSIGPVSLGTLEEFEELKTRYDFLTKQQDDMLGSIASLEETIAKINRSTKQRLTDAFEALNTKFKEVFTTLFGEGKAELILTEGDILESGIEIVAQPPGKKLKNLTLLSGGEQALTALSLLFAGFMVKPTPMCLLDEVDAPLDESNTERFLLLLAELAQKIQFITITHNRRTMEAADYLYGVTMAEPGISNVVSMHLAEA